MQRILFLGICALVFAGACYGSDTDVTDSGEALPELTVAFPEEVEPGSTNPAVIEIENPGPGDFETLVVSFSRVGAPGTEELPEPLVDVGVRKESDSIVGIDPEPRSISQDAIVYVFDPLSAGESVTITFEIEVPTRRGVYANSVIVYDGADVERARGVRLTTTVQG